MNIVDWILIFLIAVVFILALRKMIMDRKNHKSCSCGGDCSSCSKKCDQ